MYQRGCGRDKHKSRRKNDGKAGKSQCFFRAARRLPASQETCDRQGLAFAVN
jgi:hypothetical protein